MLNGQQVPSQTIAAGTLLCLARLGARPATIQIAGLTQKSNITSSLSNAPVNAFSDIEIHHMGTGLADNVSQGGAGGDHSRTAPWWGLGQRIFLLHDGRTMDLNAAIQAHERVAWSEANAGTSRRISITLNTTQQQEILDFLALAVIILRHFLAR